MNNKPKYEILNDYIFPKIIAGAEEVFSGKGYSILLGNTNNDSDKERLILKNMVDNNLAGLIIEPTKSVFPNHNKDLFDQMIQRGIPVLFIHATYQNVDSSYIIEDDVKAGQMATDYLVKMGHQKICGIFKHDDMQGLLLYVNLVMRLTLHLSIWVVECD